MNGVEGIMRSRWLAIPAAMVAGTLLNVVNTLGVQAAESKLTRQSLPELTQEQQARRSEAFERARQLLVGRGLPFEANALLTPHWREELSEQLADLPEMRSGVEHVGPIEGVVVAHVVDLPETVEIERDTIVIARKLRLASRNTIIRIGPHALYLFVVEPVEVEAGETHPATLYVDARGWGRDNPPPAGHAAEANIRGTASVRHPTRPGPELEDGVERAVDDNAVAEPYARQSYDYYGYMGANGRAGDEGRGGDAGRDGSIGGSQPCGEGGHGTEGEGGGTGFDGEDGGYGEGGGIGGPGGTAILSLSVYSATTITVDVSGGMGGWGGNGGKGGNGGGGGAGGGGGDGSDCEGVATHGGDGGAGGDGGFGANGGNGGDGGPGGDGGYAYVYIAAYTPYVTCTAFADGGAGGAKGTGGGKGTSGTGGSGGSGGEGRNGGTAGGTGVDGARPGEYGQNGSDGMNGMPGWSGSGWCDIDPLWQWVPLPSVEPAGR